MYIEKLINSNNIKEDFNKLSDNEKVSLYNELDDKKESLNKQLIQYETLSKNLESEKESIMSDLKTNYNISSIEELENRINKLSEDISIQIENFINSYKSSII